MWLGEVLMVAFGLEVRNSFARSFGLIAGRAPGAEVWEQVIVVGFRADNCLTICLIFLSAEKPTNRCRRCSSFVIPSVAEESLKVTTVVFILSGL